MSEMSPRGEEFETQPVWQEEFFYFGNANWPSDATYRVSGERIQFRVEKSIELTRADNGQLTAGTGELAAFLNAFEDSGLIVADSYQIRSAAAGDRTEPKLWIVGWQELTTDEEKAQYLKDKAISNTPQSS